MKKSYKQVLAIFLSLILALTVLPLSVFAEGDSNANEFGTETPSINCTYYTYEDGVIGNQVDGNSLTAGYYVATFSISGMATASMINLDATVDNSLALLGNWVDSTFTTNSGNPVASFATEYTTCLSAERVETNEIALSYAAPADSDFISINSDSTVIVILGMQVLQDCDAESIFAVNTNPNYTFAQPYYTLGANTLGDYDCYSLDTSASGYEGIMYPMTIDISPICNLGHSVSAKVVVMETATATTGSIGLEGVDVIINNETVATTDENGDFIINELSSGTYTATLSYAYGYDRNITIVVENADIDYETAIPMINCDFNRDGFIKSSDIQVVVAGLSEYSDIADLNKDGYVKSSDIAILLSFLSVGTLTSDLYQGISIS